MNAGNEGNILLSINRLLNYFCTIVECKCEPHVCELMAVGVKQVFEDIWAETVVIAHTE